MDSLAAALGARPRVYLRSAWPWRSLAWCAQATAAFGCLYGLGAVVVAPPATGTWDLRTPGGLALEALMVVLFLAGSAVVGAWQRHAVRIVRVVPVWSVYAPPRSVPGAGDDEPATPRAARAGGGIPRRETVRAAARGVLTDVAIALALLPLLAVGGVLSLLGWVAPFALGVLAVVVARPGLGDLAFGWQVVGVVVSAALTVALPWAWGWSALCATRWTRWVADPRGDLARRQAAERQAASVRLSDAFTAERRRIERDLHDGAQQRIVAQSMTLGRAAAALSSGSGAGQEAALRLVRQAEQENRAILADLRALVRAISPRVLSERGLGPAVDEVAARAGLPVAVHVDVPGRQPDLVEQTAYFVVLEAVTNATKHAAPTRIRVHAELREEQLAVTVTDDGVGGATVRDDGGLAGLIDRVAAIGGAMDLSSPPGGPTVVRARLPLALPRAARARLARWEP